MKIKNANASKALTATLFCAFSLALFPASSNLVARERAREVDAKLTVKDSWSLNDGRILEATLISVGFRGASKEKLVALRKSNGRPETVLFTKLSPADQKFVNEYELGKIDSLGRPISRIRKPNAKVEVPNANVHQTPKKYALLIGVNQYQYLSTFNQLKYCEKDMELLAKTLIQGGFPRDCVYILTVKSVDAQNWTDFTLASFDDWSNWKHWGNIEPNKKNIEETLDDLLLKAPIQPEDTVVVAFSGHGVMIDPDGKNGPKQRASYLCPSDLKTDLETVKTVDNLIDNYLISRQDVIEKLRNCPSRHKVLICDACRSEDFKNAFKNHNIAVFENGVSDDHNEDNHKENRGKSTTLNALLSERPNAQQEELYIISSCRAGKKSWEFDNLGDGHGFFTYYFAKGLRGDADARYFGTADGQVSLGEAFEYARQQMNDYNETYRSKFDDDERQLPIMTGGRNDGESDVFPITKCIRNRNVIAPPGADPKGGEPYSLTLNGVQYAFRGIPRGRFEMGASDSETNRAPRSKATPHNVDITKGFWLLETEVTQEMWQSVMRQPPGEYAPGGLHYEAFVPKDADTKKFPVESVSWEDCQAFIEALQAQAPKGWKFALPTEAQWEYACKAGGNATFHFGDSLNGDAANCNGERPYGTEKKGEYLRRPVEVGRYAPNDWGLFDMHGNVWEWCADWFADYSVDSATDPTGPATGTKRVNRGGGFDDPAEACRSIRRGANAPTEKFGLVGLRLALVPVAP